METKSLNIVQGLCYNYWDKLEHLFKEHWDEIAKNKQLMQLAPMRETYDNLEKQGILVCLFAESEGQVVGYSANILTPHLHYAELTTAYNDVIFLHKDYRQGPLGLRLIKETEKVCYNEGARLMLWHAKENSAFAKILERKSYGVQDIIYSKELKE